MDIPQLLSEYKLRAKWCFLNKSQCVVHSLSGVARGPPTGIGITCALGSSADCSARSRPAQPLGKPQGSALETTTLGNPAQKHGKPRAGCWKGVFEKSISPQPPDPYVLSGRAGAKMQTSRCPGGCLSWGQRSRLFCWPLRSPWLHGGPGPQGRIRQRPSPYSQDKDPLHSIPHV